MVFDLRALFEWIVRFAESSSRNRSAIVRNFIFFLSFWHFGVLHPVLVLTIVLLHRPRGVRVRGVQLCGVQRKLILRDSSFKELSVVVVQTICSYVSRRSFGLSWCVRARTVVWQRQLLRRVSRLLPETTVVSARCLHSSSSSRPSSRRVVYLFVVSSCLSCIEVLPWRVVSPHFNGWLLPSVLVRVLCVGNAVPFTGNCLALFGVK